MTTEEIQDKISSIEDQILRLEKRITDEESMITRCDTIISQKETAMTRTKSAVSQNSYARTITSEKKKKLQYSRNRDNFKKQLNQKKQELLRVQRLVPDDDNTDNVSMDSISPEDKIYQIFVSSTYEDLKMERQEVMAAIVSTGNVPIGMEYFPAGDASPFDFIKQQIDSADYYMLVIAGKYGTINKETGISYTEMEFNYAVEKHVPIAVLQYKDIQNLSGTKLEMEDPNKAALLKQFRQTSKEGRMASFWESPMELKMKVKDAVNNLIKTSPRPGWIRANRIPVAAVNVQDEPELDCDAIVTLNYHHVPDPFSLDNSNTREYDEPKAATWGDIIKELGSILTAPVSMYHINEILYGLCGGIDAGSATKVLNTLVNYGILEVGTSSNEYTGVESFCTWTSKGFRLKAQLSISTDAECDQRDFNTIKDLFDHFSTNLMDDYLASGPQYIYDKMLESFEYWHYSIGASSFIIFNSVIKDKVMCFYNLWAELMGHGEWYASSGSNPHRYRFQGLDCDVFVNPEIERNFLHLSQVSLQTASAYKELVEFIKSGYKFDLVSMSSRFEKGLV